MHYFATTTLLSMALFLLQAVPTLSAINLGHAIGVDHDPQHRLNQRNDWALWTDESSPCSYVRVGSGSDYPWNFNDGCFVTQTGEKFHLVKQGEQNPMLGSDIAAEDLVLLNDDGSVRSKGQESLRPGVGMCLDSGGNFRVDQEVRFQ